MDKAEILRQLFDKDFVEKELDLGAKDLPKIRIRTIDYKRQMELEDYLKSLSETDIAKRKFLQQYAHALLSLTIVGWGVMKDSTPEEWKTFLESKSVALLDKIVKEQHKLEKEVRQALNLDDIEETFFPKDEQPGGSKQSQEESTQESVDQSGKQ